MKSIDLDDGQLEAIRKLTNGCILCGETGSGKSRASLAYYILKECRGGLKINGKGERTELKKPKDLYIITTAKKRDNHEWEFECSPFLISSERKTSISNVKVTIDSWNNIGKYCDVRNAFFIFDEQRVVGSGPWTKSFIEITSRNRWILLSATPGDVWMDYVPVFIANGFFKNKTQFCREHVIFNRYCKYPKVDRYVNEQVLERMRDSILVTIDYTKKTEQHHIYIYTDYDKGLYQMVLKDRWNVFEDEPISQMAQVCYLLRKVVNTDPSRIQEVINILKERKRVIVFYNFDYELDILTDLCERLGIAYAQWNGHKHEEIPSTKDWVYLVQYTAGAEGWNCTSTDAMIFFSENYSFKTMHQAAGRIDRRSTPFKDLYYYHLTSESSIDDAIRLAIARKKTFNEKAFLGL